MEVNRSLSPERKKEINGHIIEEFYWHGEFLVYVDHCITQETFQQACDRLQKKIKKQYPWYDFMRATEESGKTLAELFDFKTGALIVFVEDGSAELCVSCGADLSMQGTTSCEICGASLPTV